MREMIFKRFTKEDAPIGEDIDHPPWGIIFAVILLVVYYFSASIQYFLLSSAYRLTHTVPSDRFLYFLKLFWPTFTDLVPLLLAYLLITRFYRLPFRPALGWSWPERLRKTIDGKSVSPRTITFFAGIYLAAAANTLTYLIPGSQTTLDDAIRTSPIVTIGWMISGVLTAPLLEELIFRGVLYPALLKKTGHNLRGTIFAVAGTSAAFLAVHIRVYKSMGGVPHVGHLSGIALAAVGFTLMRAYSKRLLPCYFMHLVFNLCAAVIGTLLLIAAWTSAGSGP